MAKSSKAKKTASPTPSARSEPNRKERTKAASEQNRKNPADHTDPETTGDELAYEFLRRNPEYRKDYLAAKSIGTYVAWNKLAVKWGFDSLHSDPEKRGPVIERVTDAAGNVYPPQGSRWPPRFDSASVTIAVTPLTAAEIAGGPAAGGPAATTTKATVLLGPTNAVAIFDLSYPLEPQLQLALKDLTKLQKGRWGRQRGCSGPKPRVRQDKYPMYLRLLDAEEELASLPEQDRYDTMAKTFFRHAYVNKESPELAIKNVTDGLAAARKLRDGGYRYLPLLIGKRRASNK